MPMIRARTATIPVTTIRKRGTNSGITLPSAERGTHPYMEGRRRGRGVDFLTRLPLSTRQAQGCNSPKDALEGGLGSNKECCCALADCSSSSEPCLAPNSAFQRALLILIRYE